MQGTTQLRSTKILDLFDTFLIDCDGVLWRKNTPIAGASAAIKALQEHNKQVIFVSNNCGVTVDTIQHKIRTLLDIDSIQSKNIITSGVSTAIYIKNNINVDTEKVYLIAQDAMEKTLADYGIKSFGAGPTEVIPDWKTFVVDPSVKYVVVSFDPHVCYTKLVEAYLYITENNAHYIAPDCDPVFSPSPTRKIPGSLCVSGGISAILERKPKIMGKPDPFLFELLQMEHGNFDRTKTIMIGDSYATDIMFGINCGITTALVLTGTIQRGDVESFETKPDFVLDGLGNILD